MPTGPTAQNYDAEGKRQAVYTMPESTGLEEVGSIGTGIMLIKREVAVVQLSDWQLGKKSVDYDIDTAAKRLNLLAEKVQRVVEIQRKDHPVDTVKILLTGDLVESDGNIFPGQAYEVEAGDGVVLGAGCAAGVFSVVIFSVLFCLPHHKGECFWAKLVN